MKKLFLYLIFISLVSCDSLLNQKPESMVASSNFWQTEEDLASSSRGMHVRFRSCFSNTVQRMTRDRGFLFDYKNARYTTIGNNELEKNWHLNHAALDWENEYKIISQANQILTYAGQAKISQERKNFYRGEALTIRAFTYFYIIRTWGNAILITQAFETGEKGLTTWQEIADFIIRDLEEAATLLPATGELRDFRSRPVVSKQIPSRGTAQAILAHVCAWKGSLNHEPELLKKGIQAATAVIKSGDYELAATPHDVVTTVFKGNSKEGIFELDYYDIENETNSTGVSPYGYIETYPVFPNTTPATRRTYLRLSEKGAKEIFNTCGTWFDEIFYNFEEMEALPENITKDAAYIWKFRDILLHEGGPQAGLDRAFDQNDIIIRLAGIILLRAEMRVRTGDISGATEDLNTVRKRCEAAPYSASEGDLLEIIFRQREQELFMEGITARFFDIVRYGIEFINKKLPGRFKEVKSLEEVFIPYSNNAFVYNTLMTQNQYWQQFPQFRR